MSSILDLFINSTYNASNFVQFDQFQISPSLDSSNRSNALRKQTKDNISLMIKHNIANNTLKQRIKIENLYNQLTES